MYSPDIRHLWRIIYWNRWWWNNFSVIYSIVDSNWLNSVRHSLSVKTGTLVFAYDSKIIVLSAKWDSRTHQSKYSITWSDELPPYDDITAVLCIPITNDADDVNRSHSKPFRYGIMDNCVLGCCWHSDWIRFRKMSADHDSRSSDHITTMVPRTSPKHSITQRKEANRWDLCYV